MNFRTAATEAASIPSTPAGRAQRDLPMLRLQAQLAYETAIRRQFGRLLALLAGALERRRAEAELRALSDRALADIGLDRGMIARILDRAVPSAVAAPAPARRAMRPANDLSGRQRAA